MDPAGPLSPPGSRRIGRAADNDDGRGGLGAVPSPRLVLGSGCLDRGADLVVHALCRNCTRGRPGATAAALQACGSAPVAQLGGCVHPCNKKDVAQFSAVGATKCEYGVPSLPRTGALLQLEPACLTLGRASDAVLAESLHDANPLARGKENIRTDLQPKGQSVLSLQEAGSVEVSDPSECGSTTGATGESESHRKWREMKQNGFLSSTHGTAVAPKPRGRRPSGKGMMSSRGPPLPRMNTFSSRSCQCCLSVAGASAAGHTRLAALKRSRKRVRNALQTELPHLISTEFSSSQENEPSIAHSSEAGPTGKTVSEEHITQWKSLFLQMERTLQEEGGAEIRLKEVQGMLQNCDKGLKQVTCEAPLLGPMAELWKLKNPEISESEWAVQAAAASIYSTCNLVMKTENVSCF
ncbi:hypothetical protein ZWY2020_025272 [Hordeum vulgare]|nr:hypothetical protein ZWY2020_025272 [Hordeum vulgare]